MTLYVLIVVVTLLGLGLHAIGPRLAEESAVTWARAKRRLVIAVADVDPDELRAERRRVRKSMAVAVANERALRVRLARTQAKLSFTCEVLAITDSKSDYLRDALTDIVTTPTPTVRQLVGVARNALLETEPS